MGNKNKNKNKHNPPPQEPVVPIQPEHTQKDAEVVPPPSPPPPPPPPVPSPAPKPEPRPWWEVPVALLLGYLGTIAIVLPASYANSGQIGLWVAFFGTLPTYYLMVNLLRKEDGPLALIVLRGAVVTTVSGLLVGILLGPITTRPVDVLLGLQIGLAITCGAVLFCACRAHGAEPTLLSSRGPTFLLSLVMCGAAVLMKSEWGTPPYRFTWAHRFDLFAMFMTTAIVATLLLRPALWVGNWMREGLMEIGRVTPMVRAFARGLAGFAAVYMLICLLFATWYWALFQADDEAFKGDALSTGPPWDRFVTFLYFSTVTILTMGYSDLTPNSPWARLIMSVQFVVGLSWTTVFFAFMMTRFQKEMQADEENEKAKAAPPPGGPVT